MQPKQSNTLCNASLATSRTSLGKRAQDEAWCDLQFKRKRPNCCDSIRTTSSKPGRKWQHTDNIDDSGSTARPEPTQWTLPFTKEDLELLLTHELVESLQLHDGLTVLCSAPPRPLITQSYLSELDLVLYDAKFRYNVNFEKKGFFQPSYQGDRGRRKFVHEQQYWEAMSIEFAIYTRYRHLSEQYHGLPWSLQADIVPGISILWRFPQMLTDLSDLVCMVVPRHMWDLVRQRFDVPLIMQKLGRGIFKLNALVEWLGMLLQRSCAPRRDAQIRAAVATTTKAVCDDDLKGMVLSLKEFFYIIETMKLDSVNYCIKHRRVAIVDTTVTQQQAYFQQAMESNRLSVTEAQKWFRLLIDLTGQSSHDTIDLQDVLTEGIVGIVKSSSSKYPSTFLFDTDRLHSLQTRFRYKLHKEIIRRTLAHFATRSRCHRQGASTTSSQHLLSRIDAMLEPADLASNWSTNASTIALEIVRCLPDFNNSCSLPTMDILQEVETFLKDAESEASELHTAAEEHLQDKLRPLVAREVKSGKHLTLSQLSNRFQPCLRQDGAPMNQQEELEAIAKKIAHLSILHWRIWGPILYRQLFTNDKGCVQESLPRIAEVGPRGSCMSGLRHDSNEAMFASSPTMDSRLI